MNIKNAMRASGKVLFNAGVLFPVANIFAFAGSGNLAALIVSAVTAGVSATVSYANVYPNSRVARFFKKAGTWLPQAVRDQFAHPLRVNAWGTALPTAILVGAALLGGFSAAALFPMIAGAVFASGSFVATSKACQAIQNNPKSGGFMRVITNPAVHWSVGYIALGLSAGGGLNMLMNPLSHLPALVMTGLGAAVTVYSTVGLVRHQFSDSGTPFMALSHATAVNAMAAAVTLNVPGVANMLTAGMGEGLIGLGEHGEQMNGKKPGTVRPVVTGPVQAPRAAIRGAFYKAARTIPTRGVERFLGWPLRLADRHYARPSPAALRL